MAMLLRGASPLPMQPSSPQGHVCRRHCRNLVVPDRANHWAPMDQLGRGTVVLSLPQMCLVSVLKVDNKAAASIEVEVSDAPRGPWRRVASLDHLPRDRPIKIPTGHLPFQFIKLSCVGHADGVARVQAPALYSVEAVGAPTDEIRGAYGVHLHHLLVERTENLLYQERVRAEDGDIGGLTAEERPDPAVLAFTTPSKSKRVVVSSMGTGTVIREVPSGARGATSSGARRKLV